MVDAVTHAPIGRALVYSSDNRFAMLTDGEGHFEFTLPKVGSDSGTSWVTGEPHQMWALGRTGIWLMARKPGFVDDSAERRQLEATPGGEITISLMPEALIKGRVTLSGADAALGVTVQIFSRQVQDGFPRWVPKGVTRANSNGEFRFADLQPGAYKLLTHELIDNDPVATAPGGQLYGFAPVYYPGATNFAAAATIQLAGGQTFQSDLTLTRQPYYNVKIPVAKGDISGGMNVSVSVQGRPSPGYSLGYNDMTGRIGGMLPNGNYVVEAITYGPTAATGMVHLAVTGAPADGPTMMLTRSSSVVLNVKEEFSDRTSEGTGSWSDGKHTYAMHGPRLYLQVRAEGEDGLEQTRSGSVRQPKGPNDDSLVIENLAPGRYWLRLTSSRGYVAAATMGGVDLLHEPLVVAPGSSTPIEIRMRDDSAEIEGTVAGLTAQPTTPEGPPFSRLESIQAWVYCIPLPDSSGVFQLLAVSSEGKFSHAGMAPGSYRILAFKNQQPNLPYRDAEGMRAYEAKGQVVQLEASQKATVQVQLISSSE